MMRALINRLAGRGPDKRPRFSLSRKELREMRPCDLDERLERFGLWREWLSAREAFRHGFAPYELLWVLEQRQDYEVIQEVVVALADACEERVGPELCEKYAQPKNLGQNLVDASKAGVCTNDRLALEVVWTRRYGMQRRGRITSPNYIFSCACQYLKYDEVARIMIETLEEIEQ